LGKSQRLREKKQTEKQENSFHYSKI